MITALIATALIETFTPGPKPMACIFPASAQHERPIELRLTARPSLKDSPGLYRVEFDLGGSLRLFGAAQPMTATAGRDIIVRAVQDQTRFYTVGIDDQGAAALNVQDTASTAESARAQTRTGSCRNYQRYIDTWATS